MARMPDVSVHAQRIGIRAFSRVQPLPHSQRARVPRAYEPGRAETPSSLDRAIASLTFLVPLFDSLRYGRTGYDGRARMMASLGVDS